MIDVYSLYLFLLAVCSVLSLIVFTALLIFVVLIFVSYMRSRHDH